MVDVIYGLQRKLHHPSISYVGNATAALMYVRDSYLSMLLRPTVPRVVESTGRGMFGAVQMTAGLLPLVLLKPAATTAEQAYTGLAMQDSNDRA